MVEGEAQNFEGAGDYLRGQGVTVVDLELAECVQMLGEFIANHAEVWDGDIGER